MRWLGLLMFLLLRAMWIQCMYVFEVTDLYLYILIIIVSCNYTILTNRKCLLTLRSYCLAYITMQSFSKSKKKRIKNTFLCLIPLFLWDCSNPVVSLTTSKGCYEMTCIRNSNRTLYNKHFQPIYLFLLPPIVPRLLIMDSISAI